MKNLWICPVCGTEMIKSSEQYLACPSEDACKGGHGRLYPAPRVEDLPLALQAIFRPTFKGQRTFPHTKLFTIAGRKGLWRYIPHAHETALDKMPEPGVVIAKVLRNGKAQARVFKQASKEKLVWS